MLSQSKGLTFNRQAAVNTIHQSIESGDYVADLFANTKVDPPVYHYIITKHGSNEIVDWGQGFSLEAIRRDAQKWIAHFAEKIAS